MESPLLHLGQPKAGEIDPYGNLLLHFERGRLLISGPSLDTLKEILARLL